MSETKKFRVKKGGQVQHENVVYSAGELAPFDSSDLELALFHAANIEIEDETAIALASSEDSQAIDLIDSALGES